MSECKSTTLGCEPKEKGGGAGLSNFSTNLQTIKDALLCLFHIPTNHFVPDILMLNLARFRRISQAKKKPKTFLLLQCLNSVDIHLHSLLLVFVVLVLKFATTSLSVHVCRMAQDGKVLALGVLAGAAGISLAAFWYQSRRAMVAAAGTNTYYLSSSRNTDQLDGGVALQGGQTEVLDRLGALIQCVSELKEEVKALKNALPHLQDHIRDELTGRSRKASPLNRTTPTKRKRASEAARAQGYSSEEAESEGG